MLKTNLSFLSAKIVSIRVCSRSILLHLAEVLRFFWFDVWWELATATVAEGFAPIEIFVVAADLR